MKRIRKRELRIGPLRIVITSINGEKYSRVLARNILLFGYNNIEKGVRKRGRHLHFYFNNLFEVKVYLNGRWPFIAVKKVRRSIRRGSRDKKR